MNFGFTEEQEILRSEVSKFLADRCPMEEARRIMETPEGYSPEIWKELAELGWLGLLVREEYGGVGLGWVDLLVMLEETGRSLFPSPLISSSLAVLALQENATPEQLERWLPGIASGTAIHTVAFSEAGDVLAPSGVGLRAEPSSAGFTLSGEKLFVSDATIASHFVVACRHGEGESGFGLAVIESGTAGVSVTNLPLIDDSKRLGKVVLDGVAVAEQDLVPLDADALQRILDHGAALVTAETVGAAEGAHALMVEYAKQREQFGSLIGRFQGVKHPLAEMYVDIESIKSLIYYAAWCLEEEPAEAGRHVSMAKALAGEAITRIGIDAVELHGAIGYTWEYDAQLYLKRSKWAKSFFGSSDHHYDRVATLGDI